MPGIFETEYKKLNAQQRRAVDTIDGPVMVVAGPGTGKTQVLALRIANILRKTDSGPEGILCLTFTNSGVRAMRQRLLSIIGPDAAKVRIATFHSFALDLIQKHHTVLDMEQMPELLDDIGAIAIADDLLEKYDWEHIRSRTNSSQYFYDIKLLVSLLKREQISPDEFLRLLDAEIESLRLDPASVSSRGETKGQIKKEVLRRIESLQRTREVVRFYELYEEYKRKHSFIDYDDVLRLLVELVSISEDAVSDLRENFLYVLVDEHQDSSGVQNEFLEKVWRDTERPNIFVVGDDRQLIYGFGGASLSYFENFKTMFGRAELITLIQNYRSSQTILDAADSLLTSTIAPEKLQSSHDFMHPVRFYEMPYQRDEILLAGMTMQKMIKDGLDPNECAVLVPKNSQVKSAVAILSDLGLPVAAGNNTDLFLSSEANVLITVLRIVHDPYNGKALGEYLLSPYSAITPLEAHAFLRSLDMRNFSLESLAVKKPSGMLFETRDPVAEIGHQLSEWVNYAAEHTVYETLQHIGEKLLLAEAYDHAALVTRAEVIRTMLHLCIALGERNGGAITLGDYLAYLDRLNEYGEHIPLAVFQKDTGVKVMTMHASKGLEFEFVWVGHMDERSLFSSKASAFGLPEQIETLVEEKDDLVVKRQVYVAMTRAKKYCNLSFARESYTGGGLERAHVFDDIADTLVEYVPLADSEKILLDAGVENLVTKKEPARDTVGLDDLAKIVSGEYDRSRVSVTLLNNFFECPWKWYFRNLLQLPEAKSISLIFGSIIHGCVEDLIQDSKSASKEVIDMLVAKHVNKAGLTSEHDIRRTEKDARKILLRWAEDRLPQISTVRESERSLSVKDKNWPHLTLYGKIDLLERLGDGRMRVTDFKTGKPKSKSEIEKRDEEGRMSGYLRQLAMYSYLVKGAEKRLVDESVLEFVETTGGDKNGRYAAHISEEEVDLLIRDIADYDRLLKSGEWTSRPCNAKTYLGGECEYCALAKAVYH